MLFETLKCQICGCISGQVVKCKQCSALYCKDCPYVTSDQKMAILGEMNPTCIRCLSPFPTNHATNQDDNLRPDQAPLPLGTGLNLVDEYDHFNFKSKSDQATQLFGSIPQAEINKYKIDRNLQQILNEDIQVYCQYSDCASCTKKQGSLESILRHQQECRACDDCKYLCRIKDADDCNCQEYYTRDELKKHMEEVYERKEAKKKLE